MKKQDMLFQKPDLHPHASKDCNDILMIGALSARLAQEERSHIFYESGRPENVAEHAHMLTRIAPVLASRYYPALSQEKIMIYATIHDDVEAYVGDTPTHEPQFTIGKAEREAAGLTALMRDFQAVPEYCEHVEAYEKQSAPEARFVRVVDKLLPLITNLTQKGQAFAGHWTRQELIYHTTQKSDALEKEYPEFIEIVALRRELSLLAAETLSE